MADNLALFAAAAESQSVVPVFVLDPAVLDSPYHRGAAKRKSFLFHGLTELDRELRAHGSRLIVRAGGALEVLSALAAETQAHSILACADFSPFGARRDARVARHLPLTLVNDLTIHHPAAVRKANGEPYTVFTPFSRAWRALPATVFDPAPAPTDLHTPARLASAALPPAEPLVCFLPGEQHAREALRSFVSGSDAPIYDYAHGRNQLAIAGTSALSPYLRFGMLSARVAYAAGQLAAEAAPNALARAGAEAWLNELIWREFYIAILHNFPHVRRQAFRAELRAIPWRNEAADFAVFVHVVRRLEVAVDERQGRGRGPCVFERAVRVVQHRVGGEGRARIVALEERDLRGEVRLPLLRFSRARTRRGARSWWGPRNRSTDSAPATAMTPACRPSRKHRRAVAAAAGAPPDHAPAARRLSRCGRAEPHRAVWRSTQPDAR